MAIFLVAMATATLFLFLYVVFKGTEERIWFIYFSGSLVHSFCSRNILLKTSRNSNIFFQRKY